MNCTECGAEQISRKEDYIINEHDVFFRSLRCKDSPVKITICDFEIWKCVKCDEEEFMVPYVLEFLKSLETVNCLFPDKKEVFLKLKGQCWLISLEKFT
jgi:hypothetical protein